MQEFEGKIAVVTGAASGIGLATATRFAREGMKVVLADIEPEPLKAAAQGLADEGHEVMSIPTDVSSWDSVKNLADRTMERFGAVHIIHNNAGVVASGPIWDLSLEDWKWVMNVNLWGVIYGIKAFVPLIRQAGEGHVVNTSSTAGIQSSPAIAPYNVSKYGVVAATETLQLELKAEKSNIGVSVLIPGAINTRIAESERNRPVEIENAHKPSDKEDYFRKFSSKLLAEKGLDPADVAEFVVRAIREKRFWILTHPDWKRVMRERIDAMIENDRLVTGFGG